MASYIKELTDTLPMGVCVVEIVGDENDRYQDIIYHYANQAFADLENRKVEDLIGKSFFDFFPKKNTNWFDIFGKTAFEGIEKKFTQFIPTVNKYFQISLYKLEDGICGCFVEDVSEKMRISKNSEKQKQITSLFLKTLTDTTFFYDEKKRLFYNCEVHENDEVYAIPNLYFPDDFVSFGMLCEEDIPTLKKALDDFETSDRTECLMRVRAFTTDGFEWYHLEIRAFYDELTNQRECMGYLKNVNQEHKDQLQLQEKAYRDGMTGVFNASTGRELIDNLCKNREKDTNYAFFMIDIDDFKKVNDTYGHANGDAAIKKVAKAISDVFTDGDIVARFGGDEFVVFTKECEPETIHRKYDLIDQNIKENVGYGVSISAGVYISAQASSVDEYYVEADKLLYKTKLDGKNRYLVVNDEA